MDEKYWYGGLGQDLRFWGIIFISSERIKYVNAIVTNDKVFLTRSCDMCQLVKPFLFEA